jgi:hypothetical protein
LFELRALSQSGPVTGPSLAAANWGHGTVKAALGGTLRPQILVSATVRIERLRQALSQQFECA